MLEETRENRQSAAPSMRRAWPAVQGCSLNLPRIQRNRIKALKIVQELLGEAAGLQRLANGA